MNNIFKVIWNHATQTWTAVGELASSKGKSKSVKLAAISTALLIVTGGAQTAFASDNDKAITDSAKQGSSTAKTATIQHDASMQGGLAISPDRVSDQFKGGDRYRQAVSSTNIAGATVYAYDGIAIGSGTVAGTPAVGGNGHVAIGLMARANGAKTNGAAVALGAYAVAEEQEAIAIGNQAYANKAQAVSIGNAAQSVGNGSVAVGNQSQSKEFNSTAVGDGSTAEDARSTALGSKSSSKGDSATSIGNKAKVDGTLSTGVGSSTTLKGSNIASLGSGSNISSNNVSALGAGITVGDKRDGAVVLGYGSDAGKETTKVMAVNSAVAEGSPLVYSGFSGKLGGTDTDGTNKEATGKQGNFVSVGSEGNERQIKHVAAGQITDKSTDAINGSQLYQVAKTLGTAANQTANALGVTLNKDGTLSGFSQPLTIADGSDYNKGKPAITAPNVTTALTNLNNYVNAGWNVTASGNDYENNVSVGHTVNFVGTGNVDVDGSTIDGVRTVNISVDSPLDYASTKAEVDGKEVDVVKANDGKWYPKDKVDEDNNPKEGAASIPSSEIVKKGAKLTDSDTENNPYEKGNSYTYDDNGNITATGYDKTKPESKDEITAGKNGVQLNNVGWATQPDQAVNKDQLDQTVNKSGFFIKNNGKDVATNDSAGKEVSPKDKVTPNDVVNFKGDGIAKVNVETVRDDKGIDTTTITVGVDTSKLDLSNAAEYKAEENTGITVNTTAPQNGGKTTITVGNKYFKTNADANAEEAKVEADAPKGSVAIGPGAKAGKVNTGSYSLDSSANVAGKPNADTRVVSFGSPGKEAQIQNVAAGVVSETSTDAVNGSQLHATNTQVNKNTQAINAINKAINNQAGAFDRLERKINKQGKEARAGIAGANAAAALPQAYTQGKAMVAAAAGTFKGQNALAVGYSRVSDNGKVILKLQGNANTSGDVGAGVGVGYQW